MNQKEPRQEVKTLSIRIPIELYVKVSQYALDNELPSLNGAIVDLMNSGLEANTERDKIISQFVLEFVPKETLEKLINGQA
jgi:hypothetical protein